MQGTLVRVPFGGRTVRGFVLDVTEKDSGDELETVKGIVLATPLASPPMDRLMSDVAARYVVPRGRAFARLVPPRTRVEKLDTPDAGRGEIGAALRGYQGGSDLLAAIRAAAPGEWCLQVLPGEDRGALIAEMVAASERSVIVLVPEVRYGSITLDHLQARFPDMHRIDSARSDMERSTAWVSFAR